MTKRSIVDRLDKGERLLLDGATGSELQRRGVDVLKGSTAERLGAWSATANLEAPEVVRQVHEDYFRVGADIVTSNSFWTNRMRLESAGLADHWEDYCRAAGTLAVSARDSTNPDAYVAGGIAPPCAIKPDWSVSDSTFLGENKVYDLFAEQARVLKKAGVDCLLAEYVGHIEDCVVAVEGCATTRLPVFLGVRHVTTEGTMQFGEKIEDLARALKNRPVRGVLLMCSPPDNVSATLPGLRRSFDIPVGCYPNVGYVPLAPLRGKTVTEGINTLGVTPEQFALNAKDWVSAGADIIGGCCGTGPDHIAALRPVVKGG
ncbi:MAG: homocysteine S-methyltransferase family protein [Chloroflexi bacterium]|nr:homocysteine S-methyltransferase family protein [Chloroflexota bacterium]